MADDNITDFNIADAPESIRKQADFVAEYDAKFLNKEPDSQEEIQEEAPQVPLMPEQLPVQSHVQEVKDSDEYKKLEQQYRSLQGMFNSQSRQLQEILKKLEEAPKIEKKADPVEVKPREVKKRVTNEDREALGTDLEKTIQAYAMDAADEIVAQRETEWAKTQAELMKKNEALEAQLDNIRKAQTENEEQRFMKILKDEIENFSETDSDPDFITWLQQEDENSGLLRTEILGSAFQKRSVSRIKKLYTTWQEETGKFAKLEPKVNRQVQQQVQPTRQRAAPKLPTTTHNKIWSQSDVDKFYKDHREAIMRHDPEALKVDQEILKAVSEGRVR